MGNIFDDIRRDAEAGAKGPWRVSKVNPSRVFGADDQPVLDRDPTYSQAMRYEANARRIARVPELERIALAAEELANVIDCTEGHTGISHVLISRVKWSDIRTAVNALRSAVDPKP